MAVLTDVDFRLKEGLDALRQRFPKPEPSEFCKVANAFFKQYENQPIDYTHGSSGRTFRVSKISCQDTRGFGSFKDQDIPTATLVYNQMKWVFFEWYPDFKYTFNDYVVDRYCEKQIFTPQIDKIGQSENVLTILEGADTHVFRANLNKV